MGEILRIDSVDKECNKWNNSKLYSRLRNEGVVVMATPSLFSLAYLHFKPFKLSISTSYSFNHLVIEL